MKSSPIKIAKECLFSQESVVQALESSGYDTSRFDREFRPEQGRKKSPFCFFFFFFLLIVIIQSNRSRLSTK